MPDRRTFLKSSAAAAALPALFARAAWASEGDRVLVENVNMVKKHQKPNPAMNQGGGIVEKESPIHQSNVALYNPGTGKGDRVSFKTLEDGRKVRIFNSTGEAVDI